MYIKEVFWIIFMFTNIQILKRRCRVFKFWKIELKLGLLFHFCQLIQSWTFDNINGSSDVGKISSLPVCDKSNSVRDSDCHNCNVMCYSSADAVSVNVTIPKIRLVWRTRGNDRIHIIAHYNTYYMHAHFYITVNMSRTKSESIDTSVPCLKRAKVVLQMLLWDHINVLLFNHINVLLFNHINVLLFNSKW